MIPKGGKLLFSLNQIEAFQTFNNRKHPEGENVVQVLKENRVDIPMFIVRVLLSKKVKTKVKSDAMAFASLEKNV